MRELLRKLIFYFANKCGLIVKRKSPYKYQEQKSFSSIIPSWNDLMFSIHGKNIYEGFLFKDYFPDIEGWFSTSPAFEYLLSLVKPKFVIEVGTWKGASAIHMARILQNWHHDFRILCIDTWLGSLEFWEDHSDPKRFLSLECKHGYPQVYYRFLANVCYEGLQNHIIPFPLHSSSAAIWLMRKGVVADAIYIDGSHEEEDVFQDIFNFYQVTKKGGIIFGDDVELAGVRNALVNFCKIKHINWKRNENKWYLTVS
ncbi:MAG: class I SAM-dependent methyltransferase [Chthoniobacterales bacterium]|nr:class I SAM-dependent methyltransferase [Chthoniobacterales bacterium]